MLYRKFYEQAYHKYLNEENINDYILRVLIMDTQGMTGDMSEFFLKDDELKNEKLLNEYIDRVMEGDLEEILNALNDADQQDKLAGEQ